MADAMIYKPGDLPDCVQRHLSQATSNWLYMDMQEIRFFGKRMYRLFLILNPFPRGGRGFFEL